MTSFILKGLIRWIYCHRIVAKIVILSIRQTLENLFNYLTYILIENRELICFGKALYWCDCISYGSCKSNFLYPNPLFCSLPLCRLGDECRGKRK